MSADARVVVFDFDLTLTHWDTADRFFRWLLGRSRWRLALVLLPLPVLAPLLLSRATRRWPIRYAVWAATLGRTLGDLQQLVRQHSDAVFAEPRPLFVAAAVARLRNHLEQGDRLVIATGCLEPLARELLERGGLGHVPLVASTLRPFLGGLARDRHCFGRNKIPMLAERGFPPPWAIAYTDHHCDLPVLALSREWYLVSPKPQCVSRIERALAARATILDWRPAQAA
jgi:phosphatidylglycerophosphatase C